MLGPHVAQGPTPGAFIPTVLLPQPNASTRNGVFEIIVSAVSESPCPKIADRPSSWLLKKVGQTPQWRTQRYNVHSLILFIRPTAVWNC
jgi:hypothetical protein